MPVIDNLEGDAYTGIKKFIFRCGEFASSEINSDATFLFKANKKITIKCVYPSGDDFIFRELDVSVSLYKESSKYDHIRIDESLGFQQSNLLTKHTFDYTTDASLSQPPLEVDTSNIPYILLSGTYGEKTIDAGVSNTFLIVTVE